MEITDPYGFIYITTNLVNGKKYIGQKTFDHYGRGRWKTYLGSGVHLKNAVKKYGRENFSRDIIAITYSMEELNQLEIEFIRCHDAVESKDYYNAAHGGDLVMKYIHHSEETRARMKKSHIGMTQLVETRLKIGKAHKGKVLSKETRLRISQARKGKYGGKNHPHYGKLNSVETRTKISESNKGRKSWNEGLHYTEESRKKMSDSAKAKLSDEQLIEIREKYATGEYSCVTLAEEYPVSGGTIFNIVTHKHAYSNAS